MRHRDINRSIDSIAGREFDRHQYAGGKDGGSDLASKIERLLRSADLSSLTGEQLDHLGRVLSGGQAAAWETILQRDGWKRRLWKPGRNQPGVVRHEHGYGGFWEFEHTIYGHWRDHLSILISPKRRKYFISEPYGLSEEALRQLVAIVDAGWRVSVDAHWSTHFPGRTLEVRIWKKDDESSSSSVAE